MTLPRIVYGFQKGKLTIPFSKDYDFRCVAILADQRKYCSSATEITEASVRLASWFEQE